MWKNQLLFKPVVAVEDIMGTTAFNSNSSKNNNKKNPHILFKNNPDKKMGTTYR